MTDEAHMFKGFATAVGVNGGMVDSSLSVVGVPLVEVQQRQQLLPALAIHDLAQAICPLGKALAILCMTHYSRLNNSSHFPKHAVHGFCISCTPSVAPTGERSKCYGSWCS